MQFIFVGYMTYEKYFNVKILHKKSIEKQLSQSWYITFKIQSHF